MIMKKINSLLFILLFLTANSMAAKLVKVMPVDNQCLVIHWQDGMVEYNWDDTTSGSCNGWDFLHTENWHLCPDKDQYIPFGLPLNTSWRSKQPVLILLLKEIQIMVNRVSNQLKYTANQKCGKQRMTNENR
jgi:hypothetical protein